MRHTPTGKLVSTKHTTLDTLDSHVRRDSDAINDQRHSSLTSVLVDISKINTLSLTASHVQEVTIAKNLEHTNLKFVQSAIIVLLDLRTQSHVQLDFIPMSRVFMSPVNVKSAQQVTSARVKLILRFVMLGTSVNVVHHQQSHLLIKKEMASAREDIIAKPELFFQNLVLQVAMVRPSCLNLQILASRALLAITVRINR